MRQGEDCDDIMAHTETSETSPTGYKLPSGRDDWWAKRKRVTLLGPAETFPRIPPQPL